MRRPYDPAKTCAKQPFILSSSWDAGAYSVFEKLQMPSNDLTDTNFTFVSSNQMVAARKVLWSYGQSYVLRPNQTLKMRASNLEHQNGQFDVIIYVWF